MTHPHDQAPAPLTAEVVAEMQRDMAAGTQGPWTSEIDEDTQEPRLYGDGSLIAVFGNHMTMSEAAWIPEADARRATRLPDLEAGYLALATQLAEREKEVEAAWTAQQFSVKNGAFIYDQLTAATARIAALTKLVEWASDTLIEINTSNYGHDDVCNLNDKSVEVILGLSATITTDKGAAS